MLYQNLPVFNATYQLALSVMQHTKHIQREYRYTLGEGLQEQLLGLIVGIIYKANKSIDNRSAILEQLQEEVEIVRIYLRLAYDLRQWNSERWVAMNRQLETISKQITAWKGHAYKNKNDDKTSTS